MPDLYHLIGLNINVIQTITENIFALTGKGDPDFLHKCPSANATEAEAKSGWIRNIDAPEVPPRTF